MVWESSRHGAIILFVTALGAAGVAAIACGSHEGDSAVAGASRVGTAASGACAVTDVQRGGPADLSSDQSPFATLVLKNRKVAFTSSTGADPHCPTTIHEVLSVFDALPGSSRQVFMVDDRGDQTQNGVSDGNHRFIVSQRSGSSTATDADILLAPLEGDPGALDTQNLEVISYDASRGVNVFYKFTGGRWNLFGNGSQIDPQKTEEVTNTPGQFLCQACHPTGALNFKEFKRPWNNWTNGSSGIVPGVTLFGMAPFNAPNDALINAWINGDPSRPNEPRVISAYSLQPIITDGNARVTQQRVRHVLAGNVAGGYPGQSLKSLLRETMCDVGEVNLFSSDVFGRSKYPNIPSFPIPDGFISTAQTGKQVAAANVVPQNGLINLGGKPKTPIIDGKTYSSLVASQTMATIPDAHDAVFAFFMPARSFVSEQVGQELVNARWVSQAVISAILTTDYPNPIFSKQRCGLADTLPDVPPGTAPTDPSLGSAPFLQMWIAALNASSLEGAKGLAQRLTAAAGGTPPSASRITNFLSACVTRSTTDPAGFTTDMVQLLQQRREELRQDPHLNRGNQGFPQIIESPDLFPIPATPAVPYALHLQEDCTLGASAPVIEN